MSGYNWPEHPPLDITVIARNLSYLFEMAFRRAENRARDDFEQCRLLGGEARYEFTAVISEAQELQQAIIGQLVAYDHMRSEHIRFLKGRLIELDLVGYRAPAPT